ncbi:DUF29 domain-containing protein [Spirulina subsalsa]|uniref:DUF29 domain-containing protein n=1 Tax=Spirulina subsalsa TaxID=54311 RepID=UPI0002F666C9|nr:DUF29 domain-containing protein [Spirulina subsalsa]
MKTSPKTTAAIYEQDYNLWREETIKQLKQGDFKQVDIKHLIDELEDRGRSEKRAIYSNLKILLMHLLHYYYQPAKRSNRWRFTIREHRQHINRALKESPSLQSYFNTILTECYQDARELAAEETGLPLLSFEGKCPFTTEEILKPEYLPNLEEKI